MKSSNIGIAGFPNEIKSGIYITIAILATVVILFFLPISFYAGAEDWENHINMTSVAEIRDISLDSYDETLYITKGYDIDIWGLNNNTYLNRIYITSEDSVFLDMDWSDSQRLFAWAQNVLSYNGDPDLWCSNLVLIDRNGVAVNGLKPYGSIEPYNKQITFIKWNPISPYLAVTYNDGMIRIINTSDGKIAFQRKFEHDITQLSWSPNGNLLALISNDEENATNRISLLDPPNNSSWNLLSKSGQINDIDWSSDGFSIFFTSGGTLFRADVGTSTIDRIQIGTDPYLASSPSESMLALFGNNGVTFWDYEVNKTEYHRSARGQKPFGEWTVDGLFLYTMDNNGVIRIWKKKSTLSKPTVGVSTPLADSDVFGTINITGWSKSLREDTLYVIIQVYNFDWMETKGKMEWYYTFNTTMVPDGVLKIRVKATDIYGTSDIVLTTVTVNNSPPLKNDPPTIRIDNPVNDSIHWGIISIHGEALDDSGIIAIQIRIGTLEWKSIPISSQSRSVTFDFYQNLFFMDEGELVLLFRSFDGVFFSTIEYRTIVLSPPIEPKNNLSLRILFPTNNEIVPPTFSIKGIIDNGYPKEVFLSIDSPDPYEDIIIEIMIFSDYWLYNLSDLAEGSYSISAIARNGTSYSGWHTISIAVVKGIPISNNAPDISIRYPENYQTIKTEIFYIKGWSIDDSDVVHVEVLINNGEWKSVNGTENWSYIASKEDLVHGWNIIQARAYDGELYGISESISIEYIEESPPPDNTEVPPYFTAFLIILVTIIIILVSVIFRIRIQRKQ